MSKTPVVPGGVICDRRDLPKAESFIIIVWVVVSIHLKYLRFFSKKDHRYVDKCITDAMVADHTGYSYEDVETKV
jgi:hypothetical protein